MNFDLKISDYNYVLPDERIAKFPLDRREESKLLIYNGGAISQRRFFNVGEVLPKEALLVFNNTKVIRARIIMHKPSGARIEVFCLEPHYPADYERAFAVRGECQWNCIVGNSKKWKQGTIEINFESNGNLCHLRAYREPAADHQKEQVIRFEWNADMTFGELLEHLGRIPIPPYLNRDSQEIDNSRYQTVYSKFEGSVAAPTAGLHFSGDLISQLKADGVELDEVTLHVGAGTFLPVKGDDVAEHHMHTEHFEITPSALRSLIAHQGSVVAVGTTTVRTLESLTGLGYRILRSGDPDPKRVIDQWELYDIEPELTGAELLGALLDYMDEHAMVKLKTATRIMIAPGYKFRVVSNIITNFHQPKSTLLLLVSAFVGEQWRAIYKYALENNFRFLSYGDSSILIR